MTVSLTFTFATNEEAAAFLTGNKAAAATSTKTTAAEKPAAAEKAAAPAPAKKTAPKITRDEMVAALTELRALDGDDPARAKAVIAEVAEVKKMSDIPDDKIAAVFKAAKELVEAGAASSDDGDGL